LKEKANPAGWLCAQKRPAESLFRTLDRYRREGGKSDYPDYLFLLDDDTYLNMDQIVPHLQRSYPPQDSYAVAGCMVRERVMQHNFTFPWGGFGTIFTRGLIEKFLHPIHCTAVAATTEQNQGDDTGPLATTPRELTLPEFERLVCHRLTEDKVGEAYLFRPGMSVADLMYEYVTHWNYTNAEKDCKCPTSVVTNVVTCMCGS
jgi:hypothetical protein